MAKSTSTKSLDDEVNERARQFVRDLVQNRFKGSVTNTAIALGVSQPTVSDLIASKRGAGLKLLTRASKVTGIPIDTIIGNVAGNQLGTMNDVRTDPQEFARRAVRMMATAEGFDVRFLTEWEKSLGGDAPTTASELWMDCQAAHTRWRAGQPKRGISKRT